MEFGALLFAMGHPRLSANSLSFSLTHSLSFFLSYAQPWAHKWALSFSPSLSLSLSLSPICHTAHISWKENGTVVEVVVTPKPTLSHTHTLTNPLSLSFSHPLANALQCLRTLSLNDSKRHWLKEARRCHRWVLRTVCFERSKKESSHFTNFWIFCYLPKAWMGLTMLAF